LVAEVSQASPERQGLLIVALAECGASQVLPAVLQAAKSDDSQLRILAFRALKRIGDASCVPALLAAAEGDDADVAQAALESLESLQDKSVNEQLTGLLANAQDKSRIVLLQLAGRRRIAPAATLLWKAADDPDAAVRAAALTSLGTVIEPADLPKLVARLKDEPAAAALDKAIQDVCLRSTDRENAAQQLAGAMADVDPPVKARILAILNAVGGQAALEAVVAAARSQDESLRDAAYQVLGQWKSADVAPLLLQLHNSVDDGRLKVRAIRAYIRVARQFDMPAQQRAEMCRTALKLAAREADKQLVLEVLLRYPSDEMQQIAMQAAEDPALKDQALLVVMGMASQGVNRAELGRVLAQAGQKPVKLEIVKAEYGAGDKVKDVTAILRKQAKNYPVIFLPTASYNDAFGDPVHGTAKQLKIQYKIDGKAGEVSLSENATILLPLPK
jgi:HEAT repeat protein